jgi:leader peptidase (prepilin peptidase)/N-methyltransferase
MKEIRLAQLHAAPLALAAGALVGIVAGVLAVGAAGRAASRRDIRWQLATPVIAVGAIAGVGIGARFGTSVELAAYLLLLAVALPLSAVDFAVRKVPDRILFPATAGAVMLLTLTAANAGSYGAWWRAIVAGTLSFLFYLALALATGQLGFGDCKAAGLCGLYLGYLGVRPAALGVVAAFVLAAIGSVISRVRRGSGRDRTLAFAPYIFAGTLLVIVVS